MPIRHGIQVVKLDGVNIGRDRDEKTRAARFLSLERVALVRIQKEDSVQKVVVLA
jgi:hypothetical protein